MVNSQFINKEYEANTQQILASISSDFQYLKNTHDLPLFVSTFKGK